MGLFSRRGLAVLATSLALISLGSGVLTCVRIEILPITQSRHWGLEIGGGAITYVPGEINRYSRGRWAEPLEAERRTGIPLGLVSILTALAAGFLLVVRWEEFPPESAPEDTCPACNYDLRATPDRCPECGTPVTPSTTNN